MNPETITIPEALAATHEIFRTYWDEAKTQPKMAYAARRETPKVFDGPAWFFRQDGTTWAEREYRDGRAWTPHYSLDPSGAKLDVGDLEEGDGTLRSYDANGAPSSEGAFKGGRPSGTWRYYYPSGALKCVGEFLDSVKCGEWRYMQDSSETPYLTENYLDDGSIHVISWVGEHRQLEGFRRRNADNQWVDDGLWKRFENGKHIDSILFEMGVPKGKRPSPDESPT